MKQVLGLCCALLIILVIVVGWVKPKSRLLLTLWPPPNLYDYVIACPIDLSKKLPTQSFELSNDYVGTYFVGIFFEKTSAGVVEKPIVTDARLLFAIENDQGILFSKVLDRWVNRFSGSEDDPAGIILGHYKVPQDVPLDKKYKGKVTVIEDDPMFETKYGKVVFFIKRATDI